ncbi:MAG: hypothetical protein MUC48_03680 [Leptolyngbya sp. Prado105]|jgi:hypothetical protein|nr:hypothetical protein [Leptolyngbya sp. Prado105]
MNQELSPHTIPSSQVSTVELSKVKRLLTYIQQTAIDSENTPIQPSEVSIVADLMIQTLVLQHPHLDQIIQETLDALRFEI